MQLATDLQLLLQRKSMAAVPIPRLDTAAEWNGANLLPPPKTRVIDRIRRFRLVGMDWPLFCNEVRDDNDGPQI